MTIKRYSTLFFSLFMINFVSIDPLYFIEIFSSIFFSCTTLGSSTFHISFHLTYETNCLGVIYERQYVRYEFRSNYELVPGSRTE